jgi:hypothetical protein
MITITETKVLDRFSDSNGNVFKVIAKYNPNEENDPWVRYTNESTNQEYTCRMEAFLARFNPLPA